MLNILKEKYVPNQQKLNESIQAKIIQNIKFKANSKWVGCLVLFLGVYHFEK